MLAEIINPPPNGNEAAVSWALLPILGGAVAVVAFFLRDVFNRIKLLEAALVRVSVIETWKDGHERFDQTNHDDHTRRLDEHGNRLTRMEYGERRKEPR